MKKELKAIRDELLSDWKGMLMAMAAGAALWGAFLAYAIKDAAG